MSAKSLKVAGDVRVTKIRTGGSEGAEGWRNGIDEAYTGKCAGHRVGRIHLKVGSRPRSYPTGCRSSSLSHSVRFVADEEIREFAFLLPGDASDSSLDCVLGCPDASVVTGLCIAITFKDGDNSFCFMNIESDV